MLVRCGSVLHTSFGLCTGRKGCLLDSLASHFRMIFQRGELSRVCVFTQLVSAKGDCLRVVTFARGWLRAFNLKCDLDIVPRVNERRAYSLGYFGVSTLLSVPSLGYPRLLCFGISRAKGAERAWPQKGHSLSPSFGHGKEGTATDVTRRTCPAVLLDQ